MGDSMYNNLTDMLAKKSVSLNLNEYHDIFNANETMLVSINSMKNIIKKQIKLESCKELSQSAIDVYNTIVY